MSGAWILGGAVVLTAALAGAHRLLDGRFRGTRAVRHPGPNTPSDPREDLRPMLEGRTGERATLVQFSSAFCAPCRATRTILRDVAAVVPGVVHVEVDAEEHLDLVRRLHILKTPTTLVLDADGHEVLRASGQPTKNAVLSALGQAVPS